MDRIWISLGGMLLAAVLLLEAYIIDRRHRRRYQGFIDQYLRAEDVINVHIREHIIREEDLTWAIGVAPIVTVGIKEDGTEMSKEELSEAFRAANIQAPNKNAPCSA